MRVLSVDLGTSNTVAVLSAHGRAPTVVEVDGSATMPSAVFAAPDGTLVVGRDAVRRARTDPARFEPNPKRRIDEGTLLLGDRVVPVTEALAAVLHRVGAEVTRQLGGAAPDEVRLTHPAQWGPLRRNALLSAARQAGLPPAMMLIPEPVAAAAHFTSFPGRSLAPGMALAVYDLGAGTFDVGIVAAQQQGFTVLAEAGLPDLGGLDVDHALLTHVGRQVSGRDPVAWQRLLRPESVDDRRAARLVREDVRIAKEALSAHPQTEVALPEPFGDALVTRVELEAAIRPKLAESVQLLAATMTAAGLHRGNLAGVYLVGGSSRIPLVARLISELVGVVPTGLDIPETAVALGAHLLPRAGTTMRTDAMPPQPAAPPPTPQPVPQQTPFQQPPPAEQRSRGTLTVAVAAVVVVVAVVALVLWKPWQHDTSTPPAAASTTSAAPPKYHATKVPDCPELLSRIGLPSVAQTTDETVPSKDGEFGMAGCEVKPDPGGDLRYKAEFIVYSDSTGAHRAYVGGGGEDDEYAPLTIDFGEDSHTVFATCQRTEIDLIDSNAVFRLTRFELRGSPDAADEGACLRDAEAMLKKLFDAVQP